jgi:hypothetical protein
MFIPGADDAWSPHSDSTLAPTLAPTQAPLSTPEPGTEQNPLILALAPSPAPVKKPSSRRWRYSRRLSRIADGVSRGHSCAYVRRSSGCDFAGKGQRAHWLHYLHMLLYWRSKTVGELHSLARVRNGEMFYGAQILINREGEFTSYFDEARGENITDHAVTALKQFEDKKPCWSDEFSPSGYVVPLGLLNQAQVETRGGAFLEGQPNVVRGVYVDDICDFGATFVDARTSPTLEADYPDVMDKCLVASGASLKSFRMKIFPCLRSCPLKCGAASNAR